jgi:ABC-2 type transport system permease protein
MTANLPMTLTPAAPGPLGVALRSTVARDVRLVFSRALLLTLRNPVWLIMGLAQPLLYLVFFSPLLKNLAGVPGFPPGDPWQVFVPAIMVMLGLFGSAFAGFGLIQEWRDGVIDRMRVTPLSRFALLAGRVLRDGVVLIAQAALLIGASLLLGLRAPVAGVLVGTLLVASLGMTFAAGSYAVALAVKSEDAMAPLINGILLPVMLLSGIMLPITQGFAPDWLYWVSRCNPVAYVVDATRAAFLGDFTSWHFWTGTLITVAMVAVGLAVSTRAFARQSG